MPLTLEPNATYEYILESDRDKPTPQPVFVFRFVTCREWRDLVALEDVFDAGTTAIEKLSAMLAAVKTSLVSWRHVTTTDGVTIDYDPERLEDIVTQVEASELMRAALRNQQPTEQDKKKSESPSA